MKRTADALRPKAEPATPGAKPESGRESRQTQGAKRSRILKAALALFARQTYEAVTMDSVARAAGVAKGTLYLYFPSKEALYIGILADGLESAATRYQASVPSGADVTERLRSAIDVTIRFYGERRDLLRLLATEEPRMAEARHRLLDEWRERGYTFFSSVIDEGVTRGVFGPTDSRLATLAILGGMRSILLNYGADRPLGELSREFCDFILRGLGTGSPGRAPGTEDRH